MTVYDVFDASWTILLELAPYLILGLFIAGLLNAFVSRHWIEKHLGGKGLSPVFKAAVLGIPLPLCSCGVIPTGIAFKKQGASNGATLSFLVSTPQTGVDSVLVTYSMLNGPWAIFRPILAFVTGLVAGVLAPHEDGATESVQHEANEDGGSWFDKIFKYAFVDFLQDISRPLITGIVIAVAIQLLLPPELFAEYLDNSLLSMLVILIASIPLYVCATGSVPIAAALLLKGLNPGAALVFLMAGPATNAATITVLWKALGKRVTLVYLGTIIAFSLTAGILIEYLLPNTWFQINSATHVHEHNTLPMWLSQASAVLLLLALAYVEIKKLIPQKIELNEMEKAYKVEGMTCNHCKANVERALSNMERVDEVDIDLASGTAKVKGSASSEDIRAAVEGAGYQFKGSVNPA